MICKFVLLGLLAAVSLTSALPTKTAQLEESQPASKAERQLASVGYQRRQEAQLIDQQRELGKTRFDDEQKRSEISKTSEQRREEQAPLKESAEQKREETTQIREDAGLQQQRVEDSSMSQQKEEVPLAPTKTLNFYEAKTQIREDSPLKKEKNAVKTTEQAKLVEEAKFELPKLEQQRQEVPQRDIDRDFEQRRDTNFEQQLGQQVDLSKEYDQQRYEGQPASLAQQQQKLEFDEQRSVGIKGEAPIPEKEPYAFDYSVEGSSRRESGDSKGVVRGQYTLSGPGGSRRIVDYIADHNGFRAAVQTNEFGTESRGAANVNFQSSQPSAEDISLRLEGKTHELLRPPGAVKGQGSLIEQLPAKLDSWQVKAHAPLVEQLPAEAENWQVKGHTQFTEQLPARQQSWDTKSQTRTPEKLPSKNERANWSAKGQSQIVPVKEVSQLEELPAASKGEQLEVSAQERDDVVKSAELRKPKSLDLYASGRVSATAHRPVVHIAPRDHIVSVRHQQHHHHHLQPPARHYVTHSHSTHVPQKPLRGIYRDGPLLHQPVVAAASREVSHVHDHGLRGYSQPRLAPHTILSEEEAPIGFEAARS